MRNFILGILFAFVVKSALCYRYWDKLEAYYDNPDQKDWSYNLYWKIERAERYLATPLTSRCGTKKRNDDDTWTQADYFGCDKFQRLINRERK